MSLQVSGEHVCRLSRLVGRSPRSCHGVTPRTRICILLCTITSIFVFLCESSDSSASFSSSSLPADGIVSIAGCSPSASLFFTIQVVDNSTGHGIPLVMLRTSNYLTYYTDSSGIVAFYEIGLMDMDVFFGVMSDGYVYTDKPSPQYPPYDRGVTLHPVSGGSVIVPLARVQLGQRVYRLTGEGLYRDSVMSQAPVPIPIPYPLLDPTGVSGQDSLYSGVYRNKAYYFFGDTVCPRAQRQENCDGYGMFSVGATSCVPEPAPDRSTDGHQDDDYDANREDAILAMSEAGGRGRDRRMKAMEPSLSACSPSDVHPSISYFATSDPISHLLYPRPLAMIPPYDENTWIGGISVVHRGDEPREAMYSSYYKNGGSNKVGLLKWDDINGNFSEVLEYPICDDLCPFSHLFEAHTVDKFSPSFLTDGYLYYTHSFITSRVHQDDIANISAHQVYTPLAYGSTISAPVLDPAGWSWKEATSMEVVTQSVETELINNGVLPRSQARMQVVDFVSSQPVSFALGTINWNKYVSKYVLLGEVPTGNVSISFADSYLGPWNVSLSVATHGSSGNDCYNPLHVPFLDSLSERYIHFACTFTAMWSNSLPPYDQWYTCLVAQNPGHNCANIVPRYEYNNLIYKIDLEEVNHQFRI